MAKRYHFASSLVDNVHWTLMWTHLIRQEGEAWRGGGAVALVRLIIYTPPILLQKFTKINIIWFISPVSKADKKRHFSHKAPYPSLDKDLNILLKTWFRPPKPRNLQTPRSVKARRKRQGAEATNGERGTVAVVVWKSSSNHTLINFWNKYDKRFAFDHWNVSWKYVNQ